MPHSNAIVNVTDINLYLTSVCELFCERHHFSYKDKLLFYMKAALIAALANEPGCYQKLGPQYAFIPSDEIANSLEKIAMWLKSAMLNNVEWLQRTTASGIPLKLTKLNTLAQALAEAEKSSRRLYDTFNMENFGPEYGGVRVVKRYENGYKIIQLLDIPALRYAGYEFKNCFRDGDYDQDFKSGERKIYCLLGPQNKLHVAMDVDSNNHLRQCKGRSGDFAPKHSRYVTEFLNEQNFKVYYKGYEYTKLVMQENMCCDPRFLNNFDIKKYLDDEAELDKNAEQAIVEFEVLEARGFIISERTIDVVYSPLPENTNPEP